MAKQTVVVGLSGGVDSAVSAYLLQQQGYEVIAVFMENWDDYLNNDVLGHKQNFNQKGCTSKQDFADASMVAKVLNIPIYKVNFVKEYWENVFQKMINDYAKGITPNPDVLCNQYIKFGFFKKYLMDQFHPDFIATGHYAGVSIDNNQKVHLMRAIDDNKDQCYFLCELNSEQLRNVIFPLQNIKKEDVRKIAKEANLPVWDKKDSTGICFVGERKFSDFLSNYLPFKEGLIIDIDTNQVVGKHKGIAFYTIGQRSGLNISNIPNKYFVCKKDETKQILYVTSIENEKKYLFNDYVLIKNVNKINDENWTDKNLLVRFRHRQAFINCTVIKDENHQILIKCNHEVRAITPGQYAVFYTDKECLGGGVIVNSSKSPIW